MDLRARTRAGTGTLSRRKGQRSRSKLSRNTNIQDPSGDERSNLQRMRGDAVYEYVGVARRRAQRQLLPERGVVKIAK